MFPRRSLITRLLIDIKPFLISWVPLRDPSYPSALQPLEDTCIPYHPVIPLSSDVEPFRPDIQACVMQVVGADEFIGWWAQPQKVRIIPPIGSPDLGINLA